MTFYITAFLTLLSAALGLLFSVQTVRKSRDVARENAWYLFARSIAMVLLSICALIACSHLFLLAITGAMLVVQVIDGMIGLHLKNRMRTVGPFAMALLHAACLCLL